MTVAEKNIVSNYFNLFLKLKPKEKMEQLSQIFHLFWMKNNWKNNEEELFFSSAGGWKSDISADEEVVEIRASRFFSEKDLDF